MLSSTAVEVGPRIYFSSTLDSAQAWKHALSAHLPSLEMYLDGDEFDPESIDVAVVWTVANGLLQHMTRLKAVLSLGAGVSQLDPAQIPARVPLARLVDVTLTHTMIDYARAVVFRYHRNLDLFAKASSDAYWEFVAPKRTMDTSIAILGMGELGSAIALALSADGFEVRGWARRPRSGSDIQCFAGDDGLALLVSQSDIVINVLPLTNETKAILNRELFRCFRRGAKLVNIGRGQHLVDADLLDALAAGWVGAATLDVANVEPLPQSHPFWRHPDILITPHVAGLSSPDSAAPVMAENIRRAMRREVLLNNVDRALGY